MSASRSAAGGAVMTERNVQTEICYKFLSRFVCDGFWHIIGRYVLSGGLVFFLQAGGTLLFSCPTNNWDHLHIFRIVLGIVGMLRKNRTLNMCFFLSLCRYCVLCVWNGGVLLSKVILHS